MWNHFLATQLEPSNLALSTIISLVILVIGWLLKTWHVKESLAHKLHTEHEFEQKKRVKDETAKTKTPMLQACEFLNYRLWNLDSHLDKNWLNLEQEKWLDQRHHYLRSFVYKWLCLVHCTLEAEKSVAHIDATFSDERDLLYLKYVKAIRFVFTDQQLLKSLDYDDRATDNHFYVDYLSKYASYVVKDGKVLDYHEFEEKLQTGYDDIVDVFKFFSVTKSEDRNKSLSLIRVLHIVILSFLNEFGHEYQKTKAKDMRKLLSESYKKLPIKSDFKNYVEKHKLRPHIDENLVLLGLVDPIYPRI